MQQERFDLQRFWYEQGCMSRVVCQGIGGRGAIIVPFYFLVAYPPNVRFGL